MSLFACGLLCRWAPEKGRGGLWKHRDFYPPKARASASSVKALKSQLRLPTLQAQRSAARQLSLKELLTSCLEHLYFASREPAKLLAP
jgi:hypothetical protein